MLKTNFRSAIVGAIAVSGLLAAVAFRSPTPAAQSVASAFPISVAISGPVEVAGIAKPKAMVVITDSAPYTVPAGKLFVLTAVGSTGAWSPVTFYADGAQVVSAIQNAGGAYATMMEVPQGFSAGPTSVLSVSSGVNGRAWGYLVDF